MRNSEKRDIAIIILSYNTIKVTDRCLSLAIRSAKKCERIINNKVRVVVVDNASHDGSAAMIAQKYPSVTLFSLKKNLGFAKGNNYAMKRVKAPYYLLLNSDAFVKPTTLITTLDFMERNRQFSALIGNLTFADGSFQFSWGYLPTPLKTILWSAGIESFPYFRRFFSPIYQHDRKFYRRQRQIEWGAFAFFFLREEVFGKTGGFAKQLFLYMEDVEWCKRMKDAGFKICFVPKIKIVHLSGESSQGQRIKKLSYQKQGLAYYHQTHHPMTKHFVMSIVTIGVTIRRILFTLSERSQKVFSHVSSTVSIS